MKQEKFVEGYEELLMAGDYELLPLEEGMAFDLGGRQVRIYQCADHTKGSMSFLDSRTRYLFTGDNITRRVLLLGPLTGGTTLPEFYQTLQETRKLDFTHIVAAHVPYLLNRDWLDKVEDIVKRFRPENGKTPISFGLTVPGTKFLEFTEGRDFDDPEYCGFVYDANHLDEFLEKNDKGQGEF